MASHKLRKYVVELLFILAIVGMMAATTLSVNVYATLEYWAVSADGQDIAILKTEGEANQAIQALREKYVEEGAEDVAVSIDPELTVVRRYFSSNDEPELDTVESAVEDLAAATDENGEAVVEVTVTQTLTSTEEIPYETEYEEDDTMDLGTEETTTEGENGEKKIVKSVTTVNGADAEETILSEETTKEAVNEVITKGTKVQVVEVASSGASSSSSGSSSNVTYSNATTASGQAVVNYALQFVGNPYVYGGTSLTNGADCSGFTMSVFAHFGVSLPHGSTSQGYYGTAVAGLENAIPGDIIVFSKGHVGIYTGNGYMVHASQPGVGIIVSQVKYSGAISTIRRLV